MSITASDDCGTGNTVFRKAQTDLSDLATMRGKF